MKNNFFWKFFFSFVFGVIFSVHAVGSSTLKVCGEGLRDCNYGASIAFSSCRSMIYSPGSGITESYCATKYNKLLNQCSVGAAQCTETYVHPKANVVSILYMPPGDKSTVGHTASVSNGKTESHSKYHSHANSRSLSANIYGLSMDSSVNISQSSGYDTSVTTSVQSSTGTTWSTIGNPINHQNDVMTVWLNPIITEAVFPVVGEHVPNFTNKGMTVHLTSLGNSAYDRSANSNKGEIIIGSTVSPGAASLVSVRVSDLLQPTRLLPSQLVSRTNSDGSIIPGLLSLCENRIPEAQCNASAASSNACGCNVSDFKFIVDQHPFFNPLVANHSVAAINAVDPNGARFVPVKDASGYDLAIPIQAGVTKSFSLSDAFNTSRTYTQKVESSVESKIGFSYGVLAWKQATKYSAVASVGKSNTTGRTNTQSVLLATSSPSCYGYVNVYLDTVYHTFLFSNASNAPNPCP